MNGLFYTRSIPAWASLIMWLLLMVSLSSEAIASSEIKNIRVGYHEDYTRIVLDCRGALPVRTERSGPLEFIVAFSNPVTVGEAEHFNFTDESAVTGLRPVTMTEEKRLELILRTYSTTVKTFNLEADPPRDNEYRFVMDFYPRPDTSRNNPTIEQQKVKPSKVPELKAYKTAFESSPEMVVSNETASDTNKEKKTSFSDNFSIPWRFWSNLGDNGSDSEDGLKFEGVWDVMMAYHPFGTKNIGLGPYIGISSTQSDREEHYWNNKFQSFIGFKLTLKQYSTTFGYGSIDIGVKATHSKYTVGSAPVDSEIYTVVFIDVSAGGNLLDLF